MKTQFISLAFATFCACAIAAPTPAPIRAEIEALLTKLQASGCQFNRNGSWYDGAKAKAHLLQKLDYLEKHGTLKNAEQFIEAGASGSSASGKAYQVKCGDGVPVSSRQWLTKELSAIRSAAGPAKP